MKESDITICGHGGGRPSTKNLKTYCSQRYVQTAPNGKHKGVICVRRLKKLTSDGRKKFAKKYSTILGRNIYSQNLRAYVYTKYRDGNYYSDCSSSGMATFKEIGYNVPLLNTAGIYQSNLFEDVPVKIKDGHIQNPEALKVGDCLLFVGNDPSRPKQIGHVEYVYKIPSTKKDDDSDSKAKAIAKPTLRKGNQGYEVKVLQKNLNDAYAKPKKTTLLVEDGVFGQKTEDMLEKWQKKNKLLVDGVYGVQSATRMGELIGR